MGQGAIYCRVSTDDQSWERQEGEIRAFAKRAGHKIVGVFKETASGARNDRIERKKVMALARNHEIDAIGVRVATEQKVGFRRLLMLQQVLAQPHWTGRLTSTDLRALTPLIWEHVNPYGRFEIDMATRLPLN